MMCSQILAHFAKSSGGAILYALLALVVMFFISLDEFLALFQIKNIVEVIFIIQLRMEIVDNSIIYIPA